MMIPHLDLRLMDCAVDVWLNDIPLHRASAGPDAKLLTLPVAEYVRDGDNLLTVVPFPGTTPSSSREPQPAKVSPDARFEARLVFYEEGEFPGSGGGREAISVAAGGDAPMALRPVSQKRALRVPGEPWAWQRATVLSLTPEVRAALGRAIQQAHTAFAGRDAEWLLNFGQPYFADYARAYPGIPAAARAERFRKGFAALPGDPPWKVAPLDAANVDLRLCAEGRLVEVIDRQFRPLLRAESVPYPYPMFIGLLDGRMQMLR